jgi:hypothetical protein
MLGSASVLGCGRNYFAVNLVTVDPFPILPAEEANVP